MEPLCQDVTEEFPGLWIASEVGTVGAEPDTYNEAFPLPGLDAGIRFTMIDDERGMIIESSLYSMQIQGLALLREGSLAAYSPCFVAES